MQRVTCVVRQLQYAPCNLLTSHSPSQKKLSACEAEVSKLKQQLLQQQLLLHTQQHDLQQNHASASSAMQQQLAAAQSQIDALTSSLATQKQVIPYNPFPANLSSPHAFVISFTPICPRHSSMNCGISSSSSRSCSSVAVNVMLRARKRLLLSETSCHCVLCCKLHSSGKPNEKTLRRSC